MKAGFVMNEVNKMAREGLERCGCNASPWDRAYYAAQVIFPNATDEQHQLLAQVVTLMEMI